MSFTGTNGRSINFFHKDLKKNIVNLPFDLNIDDDLTFSFEKLPTVIGYSFSLSGNGSYTTKGNATNAFSLSYSRNYAIFTKGDYALQPFVYDVGSGKAGLDASGDTGVSFTGTFSPFFAWGGSEMDDENITPQSWEKYFGEFTIGGSVYTPEGGGGVSITGFMTPQVNNTGNGYYGVSFDLSVGIGASTNGIDKNIHSLIGGSYYALSEHQPKPTLQLLNTTYGKIKYYAKWTEFMTGGAIPATSIYNLIEPDPNEWHPKDDYKTPTFLNGYKGTKF